MRRALPVLAALVALGGRLPAQQPAPAVGNDRCRLQIENVDRQGNTVPGPVGTWYYAGGNVRLRCRDQDVRMRSDSLAYFSGGAGLPATAEFLGKVVYRDSTMEVRADRATYFQAGERWEARGHVTTRNLKNGSTLAGPSLDYLREAKGTRDTAEMYAVGRPTIRYVTKDDAGKPQEPYVIVGDRVRMRGEDDVWAGGTVTIDRSDFAARGDSLRLFTGKAGYGALVGGKPVLRGLGKDSFDLAGARIDFTLEDREIRSVLAKGEGHAVQKDLDLVADTILLDAVQKKLERVRAWGTGVRPYAVGPSYALRGDSVDIRTPAQRLDEVRAYRTAWLGTGKDTTTGERDWLAGDTVTAHFVERDSAGTKVSRLVLVEASGAARAYYRSQGEKKDGPPALTYARADHVVVRFHDTEQGGVRRVELAGAVDGIQLEPGAKVAADRPAVPRPAPPPGDDR